MQIQTEGVKKIHDSLVRSHLSLLKPYATTLGAVVDTEAYEAPESSLRTPFDDTLLEQAKKTASRFTSVQKVLLVGIGGSDMGCRAVYDALRGYMNIDHSEGPLLFSFGTIESSMLQKAQAIINATQSLEELVLIVISKSGNTTETIVNANVLFSMMREKGGEEIARRQTVVITDDTSPLAQSARASGIEVVSLPKSVGGRYSVFTAVGLVPLAILGFDIDSFREGAREAIRASVGEKSPLVGAVLASYLFEAYLTDTRIHEMFFWNPELETVGKWYRQLLAESIGKMRSDHTKIGFSPTIAVGSIDLHSVGQLIFGGRNDRFTTFVSAPQAWQGPLTYSKDTPFTLPILEGKTTGEVMSAIYNGVKNTYELHELSHVSIEFGGVNERELGAFMGLHMTMIMYVAKLFDVNAFDQPGVEAYKNEVRKLLHNT